MKLLPNLLTLDLVNPQPCVDCQITAMLVKGIKSATFPNSQRVNVVIDEPTMERVSCSLHTFWNFARLSSLDTLMVKGMERIHEFCSAHCIIGY